MLEKTIKLGKEFGKQFAGEYTFESLTWGRSNQITSECTQINPLTKQSSIDMKRLQALMLDATLKKRPSAITLDMLMSEDSEKGLPFALGELLMAVADQVNGFGAKDREKLKNLKAQWGLEG